MAPNTAGCERTSERLGTITVFVRSSFWGKVSPTEGIGIDARISGDISGQVAIGNNIAQYNAANGAVINVFPPGSTPTITRRPIPRLPGRPPARLFGRDHEVKVAAEALRTGAPVEFVGAPGMGKTTLLTYLTNQADVSATGDGVVYQEARGHSVDDVLQILYDTFYETFPRIKVSEAEIRMGFADMAPVVVLDDFEGERDSMTTVLNALPKARFAFGTLKRSLFGAGTSVRLAGLNAHAGVALLERELGYALEAEVRQNAEIIVTALAGTPLGLLKVAALVADDGIDLSDLISHIREGFGPAELDRLLLRSLDDKQRAVRSVLAAVAGETLSLDTLAATTGVQEPKPALESLIQCGLVEAHSPRYSTTTILDEVPSSECIRVLREHFVGRVERNQRDPESLVPDLGAVMAVLRQTAPQPVWSDFFRLARAVEGSLMLHGRWDAWREALDLEHTGARSTGDQAAEAWALHQLGSRALCLGNR